MKYLCETKKSAALILISLVGLGATSNVYAQTSTPVDGRIIVDQTEFAPINTSLGNVVEEVCPQLVGRSNTQQNSPESAERDLQVRCTEMVVARGNGVSGPELEEVLYQANAEEVATQGTGLVRLSAIQTVAVAARLTELRIADAGSGPGLALNQDTGSMHFGYARGGSAGESDFGRWSIYVNGELSSADKDPTANEAGFDLDGGGITAGADYRAKDNLFVGVNLALTTSEADMDNGGALDSDGQSVTAYVTSYNDNGWYFEGTAGFGQNDYEQTRRIIYTLGSTAVNQTALGDTEGDQAFASIGAGKDYVKDALVISISGNLDYLNADIDGFSETISDTRAGFGLGMEVDDQSIDSLRTTLGVQISKSISTNRGVIAPYARAEWVHQFEDDPRSTSARFLSDPFSAGFNNTSNFDGTSIFTLVTDEPDEDYFRLSGGLSSVSANGLQLFAALDTLVGLDDISQFIVTAGIRKEL